jgi:capsular polysaccharide transport system permease protein
MRVGRRPPFASVTALGAPVFGRTDPFPRLGIIDHLAVLRALILRDLRIKYYNSRFGFLLEFLRPVIVVVFHYFLFVTIQRHMPARIPVELFVIGGFSTWFTFSHTMLGTVHGRRGPPRIPGVSPMHSRIARTTWEFLANFSFCYLAVSLLRLLGWEEPISNVVLSALVLALAAIMGLGFGLVLDGVARLVPTMETQTKNFRWALYVTTGIYFSASEWHHGMADIVWYNPCLHLVEFQRHALDPGYPIIVVTLLYPMAITLTLLLLGLALHRCTRNLAPD